MTENMIKDFDKIPQIVMNRYGLTKDQVVQAILDSNMVHIYKWDCDNDEIRPLEEYAEEVYATWKSEQD